METTSTTWRNIAGLMLTRIDNWLGDDNCSSREFQLAMALRSQFYRILDNQIGRMCVEGFFIPVATAIILGFITPEEAGRYIVPEDWEFMELALVKELNTIPTDITDPTWKPPNRTNNGISIPNGVKL